MTPQLMQAIKLLQLSNLDLSAYVDNELERNPLLERTAETEAEAERRSTDGAAAQQPTEEWAERPVDAVDNAPEVQREAAEHAGDDDGSAGQQAQNDSAARLFGMGHHARRPSRRRRIQSRSLRVGGADALRPSRRAARAGDHRSGAPHDRPVPHRSRRRGRLPDRRSGVGRREARHFGGGGGGGARGPADLRPGRASARAASPNVSRSSSRSATASIPPCAR